MTNIETLNSLSIDKKRLVYYSKKNKIIHFLNLEKMDGWAFANYIVPTVFHLELQEDKIIFCDYSNYLKKNHREELEVDYKNIFDYGKKENFNNLSLAREILKKFKLNNKNNNDDIAELKKTCFTMIDYLEVGASVQPSQIQNKNSKI